MLIVHRKHFSVLLELLLLLLPITRVTVHNTPVLHRFDALVVQLQLASIQLTVQVREVSLDLERVALEHVQRFDAGDVQQFLASCLDRTLGHMREHLAVSFDLFCFADAERLLVEHQGGVMQRSEFCPEDCLVEA